MDPYKVLGLDRSCSVGDVKKAYMKLAKTVHPDKGGNEEEFKKINAAYTVLNDEEKRHFYDMTGQMPGEEGRPNVHEVHVGGGGPGMPFPFPFDVGQMFGMFNNGMPPGMRGGSGSQTQRKGPKGPNKIDRLPLSLEQFYYGHTINMSFDRMKLCEGCRGTGAAAKSACGSCRGSGQIHKIMQMGPMIMNTSGPCGDCNGEGQKVTKECGQCKGKGRVPELRQLEVRIEPGMSVGEQLMFGGACSETTEYDMPGDVVIILEEAESAAGWMRKGADLHFTAALTLAQSLVGADIVLADHPKMRDGEDEVLVHLPGPVIGGDILCVKGLGMPMHGKEGAFGNLYLTVKIFPGDAEREKIAKEGGAFLRGLFGLSVDSKRGIIAELVD
jgi:DnaJ family protein A protein 2